MTKIIITKKMLTKWNSETTLMNTKTGTVQTWNDWIYDWRISQGQKLNGKPCFPFSDLQKLVEVECKGDEHGHEFWEEVK